MQFLPSPQGLTKRTLRTTTYLKIPILVSWPSEPGTKNLVYNLYLFNWIPLFEITKSYDLVYNWLKLIDKKYSIRTLAFVIMPNHVHLLLQLEDEKINLNKVISNGKRFMAYSLIERLEE